MLGPDQKIDINNTAYDRLMMGDASYFILPGNKVIRLNIRSLLFTNQ